MKKIGKADLKGKHKKMLELGLIVSLLLHMVLMQGFKTVQRKSAVQKVELQALDVEDIAQTIQEKQAAAPTRPTVPIASEDEELSEDETMDIMDFDFDSDPPPPPPPPDQGSGDEVFFVSFDKRPHPVGGWGALTKNLVYPDIAMKAGIEGTVRINAHIDVNGNVLHTKILTSLTGCDQAAIDAVMKTKWVPAEQRDKVVEVWVAIPVKFKLR